MKRFTKEMFTDNYGINAKPLTEQTLWRSAFINGNDFISFLVTREEKEQLIWALGTHPYCFYHNITYSPLADLPAYLVIEKINRAAEQLGILEES